MWIYNIYFKSSKHFATTTKDFYFEEEGNPMYYMIFIGSLAYSSNIIFCRASLAPTQQRFWNIHFAPLKREGIKKYILKEK